MIDLTDEARRRALAGLAHEEYVRTQRSRLAPGLEPIKWHWRTWHGRQMASLAALRQAPQRPRIKAIRE